MATKPTLRHVALAAGVSAPTVSKILNGRARYSPETVAKVRGCGRCARLPQRCCGSDDEDWRRAHCWSAHRPREYRTTPTAPRLFWLRYLDQLVDCFSEAGVSVLAVSSITLSSSGDCRLTRWSWCPAQKALPSNRSGTESRLWASVSQPSTPCLFLATTTTPHDRRRPLRADRVDVHRRDLADG